MIKRFSFMLLVLFVAIPVNGQTLPMDSKWEFAGWMGGGYYPTIVPDPNVAGRVYLTSDVAGIWRSDNRGDNWYFINEGLDHLDVPVLAVAPSDSNVIYAGTRIGLFKSIDAGQSWQDLRTPDIKFTKNQTRRCILIDPLDADKVYAGNRYGTVYMSDDGGIKWRKLGRKEFPYEEKTLITSLQISDDGKYLFAAADTGITRYDFNAEKWHSVLQGKKVNDLVFYEGGIFAACDTALCFSDGSGLKWRFSRRFPAGKIKRLAVRKISGGGERVFIGWQDGWKGGVFFTDSFGDSWRNLESDLRHDKKRNPTRAWMRGMDRCAALALDPADSRVLYFTDSWGVWRSDDEGKIWREIINGAPNTVGSDIALGSNGDIYVATMDNGLLKSSDGGKSYATLMPKERSIKGVSGHVWRVLVNDRLKRLIATSSPWAGGANQVFICDGEDQCRVVTKGLPEEYPVKNTTWRRGFAKAIAIDPQNPKRVYLGIDGDDHGGLFISDDGGESWQRSPGQPGSLKIYNGLSVDPREPNRIYWGASGKKGGVYRSEDYGNTWKNVFRAQKDIYDLTVSPSGVIYVATSMDKKPALFVSRDRGATWQVLNVFDKARVGDAVLVDSENEDRLFFGAISWSGFAQGAVYYSADGGKEWVEITDGLPNSPGPAAMAFNTESRELYIVLYSGSVYKRVIIN